jgi:hypothetical protein
MHNDTPGDTPDHEQSTVRRPRRRRPRGARATAATLLAFGALVVSPADASDSRVIETQDRCEQASFDAAIGPGTCLPVASSPVSFDEFIAKANPVDFGHPKWRFSRTDTDIRPRGALRIVNPGGEFHTFTPVASFATGGCVDLLNTLLGLGAADPRCSDPAIFGETGVAPGGSLTMTAPSTPGTYRFVCLIHPWMRTTLKVKR